MSSITIDGNSNDTNLVLDSANSKINENLAPISTTVSSTLATRSSIPGVVACYFKASKTTQPNWEGILAAVGGLATFQNADADGVTKPGFFMSSHSFVETDTHWIMYVSEIGTQDAIKNQWGPTLSKNADNVYLLDGYATWLETFEDWNITFTTLDSNNFDFFTDKIVNYGGVVDVTKVHVAQAHLHGGDTNNHSAVWESVMNFN